MTRRLNFQKKLDARSVARPQIFVRLAIAAASPGPFWRLFVQSCGTRLLCFVASPGPQ